MINAFTIESRAAELVRIWNVPTDSAERQARREFSALRHLMQPAGRSEASPSASAAPSAAAPSAAAPSAARAPASAPAPAAAAPPARPPSAPGGTIAGGPKLSLMQRMQNAQRQSTQGPEDFGLTST